MVCLKPLWPKVRCRRSDTVISQSNLVVFFVRPFSQTASVMCTPRVFDHHGQHQSCICVWYACWGREEYCPISGSCYVLQQAFLPSVSLLCTYANSVPLESFPQKFGFAGACSIARFTLKLSTLTQKPCTASCRGNLPLTWFKAVGTSAGNGTWYP